MIKTLKDMSSFKQFHNMVLFKEFHDKVHLRNLRYKHMTDNIARVMEMTGDSEDDNGTPLMTLEEANELIDRGNRFIRGKRNNTEYFFTERYKQFLITVFTLLFLSFFLKFLVFGTDIFIITSLIKLLSNGILVYLSVYFIQHYTESLKEKFTVLEIQKTKYDNPLKLYNLDSAEKFNETFEKEITRGIKLSRNFYITDFEGNTKVYTEVDLLRLIVLSIINLNKYNARNFILIYKKSHEIDTNYIMKLFSEEIVSYENNDTDYKELLSLYLDYFVEIGVFKEYRIEPTTHEQPEIIFTPEFVQLLIGDLAKNNSELVNDKVTIKDVKNIAENIQQYIDNIIGHARLVGLDTHDKYEINEQITQLDELLIELEFVNKNDLYSSYIEEIREELSRLNELMEYEE